MGGTTIDGVPYNVDQWDGYEADRSRVVRHLRDQGSRTPFSSPATSTPGWACDLPADPLTYPTTGHSVAAELVCTSVTSDNLDDILNAPPRTSSLAVESAIKAANPHVKYLDFDSHGYSVLDVTPAGVRMDWYVLADRTSQPRRPPVHLVPRVVPAPAKPPGNRRRAVNPDRRPFGSAFLPRRRKCRRRPFRGARSRGQPDGGPGRRTYVLVVDGCRPDEITPP